MPTAGRRFFVPHAIRYFLQQDYPDRELVIVDDGPEPVSDLVPADERIRYIRLPARQSVGAKRNLACEAAQGAIIAHWDDDDWAAPWRLSCQVACLLAGQADLCGLSRVFYYDLSSGSAFQYEYPERSRRWVSGNSLVYRKDFWRRNRFPAINVGEDNRFIGSEPYRRIVCPDDPSFLVGIIHHKNVSPKRPSGSYWRPFSTQAIREMMGADWEMYQGAPV